MATDFKITTAGASAEVDALTDLMDGGSVKLYTGTPPATANTALSGNDLLATLALGTPSFGSAASGVATANAITDDTSADDTGTATFFRGMASNATTVVCQGTCGTADADMILNSTAIQSGAAVEITSWTITQAVE